MLDTTHNAEVNLSDFVFSDEAYFRVDGNVNTQNYQYYADSNPYIIHKQPLHLLKLHMWCVVAKWNMIGPYIFTGNVNILFIMFWINIR